MKKYLLLLPILLGLSACSDNIFNEVGGDVLDPVSLQELSGGELARMLESDGIGVLARPLLESYGTRPGEDFAMVLNDRQQLKDVEFGDNTYQWPEIDFDRYSLVVGKFFTRQIGYVISRQRIKKRTLYLEISDPAETHYFATKENYFAALYPKLASGTLTVKRSDNY